MKALLLALALGSFAAAASAQQAPAPRPHALVHADAGSVEVGNNPVAVDTSAGVDAGQTVNVQGQATITYDNGCSITVTGSYVIARQAPDCHGGTRPIARNGGVVAAGVLGGLAVVAAVAGGGGGGEDRPSSP